MFRERARTAAVPKWLSSIGNQRPRSAIRTWGRIKAPVVTCGVPYHRSPRKSTRHPTRQVPAVSRARFGSFPAALNVAELQLCRDLGVTQGSGAGRLDRFSMEVQGMTTSQLSLRGHELSEDVRWVGWLLPPSLRHVDLRAFSTMKHKGLDKGLESSDRLQGHAPKCLFSLSPIVWIPQCWFLFVSVRLSVIPELGRWFTGLLSVFPEVKTRTLWLGNLEDKNRSVHSPLHDSEPERTNQLWQDQNQVLLSSGFVCCAVTWRHAGTTSPVIQYLLFTEIPCPLIQQLYSWGTY